VEQWSMDWVHDFNHHRPHDSLKRLPPVLYAKKYLEGKIQKKKKISMNLL
jgi:transposase InsO family protein